MQLLLQVVDKLDALYRAERADLSALLFGCLHEVDRGLLNSLDPNLGRYVLTNCDRRLDGLEAHEDAVDVRPNDSHLSK